MNRFLQRRVRLTSLAMSLLAFMSQAARGESRLPRATPESQGVSSQALLELVNTLGDRFDGMHSVMIVRHGQVIAEGWWAPYGPEHNHIFFSLSKSFTSTAVGLAVAEGKLSIDDVVAGFFPDALPGEPSTNLKAMRVRDLLTMATGHQDEPSAAADTICAKSFLAQPVPHLPGTHFKYNTAATFMQSAIVQKVTGETVLDYLRPRLFEPLGIEHPVWDTNFQGISLGGYGLRARTEDIAKFGQLYLQKGVWNGRRLLPAEWIEQATSKQASNGSDPNSDWNQGYGFQFWRCRHKAFRGDGAFGQYCVVLPEQDMVVAITSGVGNMQGVLNVLWDKLLPACESGGLPENNSAHQRLNARLTSLTVPAPAGTATSSLSARVLNQRYTFSANNQKIESVTLESSGDERVVNLVIEQDGATQRVAAGFADWRKSRGVVPGSALTRSSEEPLAGRYSWMDDKTAVIKVCAYETPFHLTWKMTFDGDELTLQSEANVGFGPTARPALSGRKAAGASRESGQ
jgi:CubicO group peptidase (beta-lactamase class C family)